MTFQQIPFLAAFLCSFFVYSALADDTGVLVDTDFKLHDSAGNLTTLQTEASSSSTPSVMPLKMPTTVSAMPGATITASQDPIGNFKSPYALVKSGQTTGSQYAADATIWWDLSNLQLGSGKYTISYTVIPLGQNVTGGGFIVVLAKADGSRLYVHPNLLPMYVTFQDNTLLARGVDPSPPPLPATIGQPYFVKISFDLDAKKWSVTVNDTPLLGESSFSDQVNAAASSPKIMGLEFGNIAGRGDQPGGAWAIANVKMVSQH